MSPRQPDPDQITTALLCLRRLAGDDKDYASVRNNIGFNKADGARGHLLAKKQTFTGWDYIEVRRLIWTYRRQLPESDIEIVYRGYEKPTSVALIDDLGGEAPEAEVKIDFDKLIDDGPKTMPAVPAATNFYIIEEEEASVPVFTAPIQPASSSAHRPPSSYDGVSLTPEQLEAVNSIILWLTNPQNKLEYRLGGYAGTGKTTIIKYILALLRDAMYGEEDVESLSFLRGKVPMVCAFTGKACSVLRKKGVNASTIHSTMYRPVPKAGGVNANDIEWRRVNGFELPGNFFIVDEASMISTDIYNDMKEYKLKMLFVGDPGQLEPVGENPNLMRNADIVLKTIHRQALESPIIKLATDIRNGFPLPQSSSDPRLIIRDKNVSTVDLLEGVSQVICARNKTKDQINTLCRQAYGFREQMCVGDKLVVSKNNKDLGVFNGMIVHVKSIRRETSRAWDCLVTDEDRNDFGYISIAKEPFSATYNKQTARIGKDLVQAEYGYCLTCHKSQGSEWDHVVVIDEWMPPHVWDMKRWRYTAFTRAAKKLTVCRDYKTNK